MLQVRMKGVKKVEKAEQIEKHKPNEKPLTDGQLERMR